MIQDVFSLAMVERDELEARCRSRRLRAEDARRARLILMLAGGESYAAVQAALGCDPGYVSRWKRQFEPERLAGLYSRHRGSRARVLTPKLQAKILEKTWQKPSDGSTHQSTRRLAEAMGVNHMLVARAWARVGVKPHRMKRYMTSDDLHFESKAADVIRLCLNPPQHAAVTKTARALGKTTQRHTTEEFVAFLSHVVASQPYGCQIHIIADNPAMPIKWVYLDPSTRNPFTHNSTVTGH